MIFYTIRFSNLDETLQHIHEKNVFATFIIMPHYPVEDSKLKGQPKNESCWK